MEEEQEKEWAEAQKIEFTVHDDLVSAAKRHLLFLQAVDRRRSLCVDGPVLRRAIHRYENCWLPLLEKYSGSRSIDDDAPLVVVPLDCEWIWHCHRLNPIQYKKDCEQLYGRILDDPGVVSTTTSEVTKSAGVELWERSYPEETFELDCHNNICDELHVAKRSLDYDLVAAVIRQNSFFYQVSRPVMLDDRYLNGAVARYKGFLHLIKRNLENSLKQFCVPTYDIDIIWHSHQLQPTAYCNDTVRIHGMVLGHDDTVNDRSKGSKLNTGFSETVRQWDALYGLRYWRAGAMYSGKSPSPVTDTPLYTGTDSIDISPDFCRKYINFSSTKVMQVMLEVVSVKSAPSHRKGSLFISFGKKSPDMFLSESTRLNIQSETKIKQRACFECEPTGDLILNLMLKSTFDFPAKTIGKTSISLQDLKNGDSELVLEKWYDLKLQSGYMGSKPISLHIAVSFTVPISAPHVFSMARPVPFITNTCFFPFPTKVQRMRTWSCFTDEKNNEYINIRMRNLKNKDHDKIISKQVLCLMKGSGETNVVAELTENKWSLLDSKFILSLEQKPSKDKHIFEFIGEPMIRFYHGRRLVFAPKNCTCQNNKFERNYITIVIFSASDPYGKALALINLKSGALKVNEEWFVLPGILLAFILSDMRKAEGYNAFVQHLEHPKVSDICEDEEILKQAPMQASPALVERTTNVEKMDKQMTKCGNEFGGD